MKVLIVEDEKHARANLIKQLHNIDRTIEVLAELDTVSETVSWLQQNEAELIFLDIHLADDLSFKIFDQIEVNTPIIFTTAYDQYALRAFKLNSIDYLLKPIEEQELANSIEQFQSLRSSFQQQDFMQIQQMLSQNQPKNYQQRFLVSRRDKIMSVKVEDIAYFEGEDRYVYLIKNDGTRYIIDYKLSDLEEQLDPQYFFRLNRSFIAHFEAIGRITSLSKSRLKVYLQPETSRDIFISAANTRQFKSWLNK